MHVAMGALEGVVHVEGGGADEGKGTVHSIPGDRDGVLGGGEERGDVRRVARPTVEAVRATSSIT